VLFSIGYIRTVIHCPTDFDIMTVTYAVRNLSVYKTIVSIEVGCCRYDFSYLFFLYIGVIFSVIMWFMYMDGWCLK